METVGLQLGQLPTALALVDGDGNLVEANPRVCHLFGWAGAPLGEPLVAILDLPPDSASALLPGGSMQPVAVAVPGSTVVVEVTPAPVRLPDDARGTVLHFRPVPSHGQVEQMVLEAHDLLGEGVVVGDGRQVLHVNDAACRLFGYRREELLAMQSLFGLFRPDEQERMAGVVASMAAVGQPPPERWETVIVRHGGDELPVELSIKAVVSRTVTRTLTIIRDNSERRRLEEDLTRRALHDKLTGLPNRVLFTDRFNRALARARRDGSLGALMYVDLDGFKAVNDRLGHAAGDAVLVAVADRLLRAVRQEDTAARMGGDEFVVVCEPLDDPAHAELLAGRIARAVAAPIPVGAGTVEITASIGVQLFGVGRFEPGELLHQADQAMYRVKRLRQAGPGAPAPGDGPPASP